MRNKPQDFSTETDKSNPQGVLKTAQIALNRYGFIGTLGRWIILQDEIRKFINRADSDSERLFRRALIGRFNLIQRKMPCAHHPFDFILMAEYILDLKLEGPIIECGCFKGGSTAKLSLLAEKTHRLLYVCDSFEGLPQPKREEELLLRGHEYYDGIHIALSQGEYRGELEEVKENIGRYGCIEVCRFIPGLFNESLEKLDVGPAFVFIDVDLVSSARDCLRHLWPRLVPNGYWFTHEARYPDYLRGILDDQWWHDTLGVCPPAIMGAGSGLSILTPVMAYFQKTR